MKLFFAFMKALYKMMGYGWFKSGYWGSEVVSMSLLKGLCAHILQVLEPSVLALGGAIGMGAVVRQTSTAT